MFRAIYQKLLRSIFDFPWDSDVQHTFWKILLSSLPEGEGQDIYIWDYCLEFQLYRDSHYPLPLRRGGSALYVFFQIPVRLTMWSSGLALFTHVNRREAYKKLVKHPCIIAVFAGMLLMMLEVRFPVFLENTLRGSANAWFLSL